MGLSPVTTISPAPAYYCYCDDESDKMSIVIVRVGNCHCCFEGLHNVVACQLSLTTKITSLCPDQVGANSKYIVLFVVTVCTGMIASMTRCT